MTPALTMKANNSGIILKNTKDGSIFKGGKRIISLSQIHKAYPQSLRKGKANADMESKVYLRSFFSFINRVRGIHGATTGVQAHVQSRQKIPRSFSGIGIGGKNWQES